MKINHHYSRTVLVPPQPQLLQGKEKKTLKEKRGGLIGLFESVIGDFVPGLSRRRRSTKEKKEECKMEGRSGEIVGEVLASTRDMLNLWLQLESMDEMEEVDWCAQVRQAAGRGDWARFSSSCSAISCYFSLLDLLNLFMFSISKRMLVE